MPYPSHPTALSSVLLVVFLLASTGALAVVDSTEPSANWRFEVSIDDRRVGYHDYQVTPTEGGEHILSSADFNLKLLFVNVFSYVHRNSERWEGDCLAAIDSSTKMNRKDFSVQGTQEDDLFQLTRGDANEQIPGCVQTFAYWNTEFLAADRLLNSQTGEMEKVTIELQGEDTLAISDQVFDATRYRIELSKGHIDLWYDSKTQLWLGLESVTPEGRSIRYKPVQLPAV